MQNSGLRRFRRNRLHSAARTKSGESEAIGILPFRDLVCFSGQIGRAEVEEVEKDMLSSLNKKNKRFSSRQQQIDLAATVHYQSS